MTRFRSLGTIGRGGLQRGLGISFLFFHPNLVLVIIDGDSLIDEGIEVGATTDDSHGFLHVGFQLVIEEEAFGTIVEI